MSQRLVSLNEDLSLLRADGYDVAVGTSGYLLIRSVPYLDAGKGLRFGVLAMVLDLAGDKTVAPQSHVAFLVGECPCGVDGSPLPGVSQNTNQFLGDGLTPNHQISRKPTLGSGPSGYSDYHHKVTTYLAIVCGPAQSLYSTASAKTYPTVLPEEDDPSVFNYLDTGATKAGIVEANGKLKHEKTAIVGVGGTGAYILDFLAKTLVAEIHLFDHDIFINHNAFRCPGAAGLGDLERRQQKVQYLAAVYSKMRKGVIPHDCFVDEATVDSLKGMDFVFICIDKGAGKRHMLDRLEEWNIPFIDVGMGIQLGNDHRLGGIITVTTSSSTKRNHVRRRIALVDGEAANEYSRNVQIAELNALNAALAVIRWKKLRGYYDDTTMEHWCAYTIRTNQLISEDIHEA